MKKRGCRLIIFAKAPIPGQVKTRLISFIGAKAATALHEKLVLHCLEKVVNARIGPIDLWCTPSARHPFFTHCKREYQMELHTQPRGDLGDRMAFAFRRTLRRAFAALLIGTDAPSLTEADLREAAEVLLQDADAVISPAEDGGYVLIGLRQYASDLFSGISWGTDTVMEETRLRLRSLGWRWHELSLRWDVDRPEDLERLMKENHLKLM